MGILLFFLFVEIANGLDYYNSIMNPLDGRRAPCQFEGQPIAVDHIDKAHCYSCICKNGFVECRNDYQCPPIDGCHMLVEKSVDGCCRQCKGCSYGGEYYRSHTEWRDGIDPCRILRCEAGVVTESNLKCYTPCSEPFPPRPGECCPTCPECKINGQLVGMDRDVTADDPCVKCRCQNGRMTCKKYACPVLQCAGRHQASPAVNECCPHCTGTRTLLTVPRTCTIQNAFFHDAQAFSIDRCTTCQCVNETSICRRSVCPVLDCAPDLQMSLEGNCCKQCMVMIKDAANYSLRCFYAGKYYEDGESWQMSACQSCKCQRGLRSCATTQCNNINESCSFGQELMLLPDECCKRCIEVDGVCMVYGAEHYKTFDGAVYSYQSIGRYHLATSVEGNFSIRIANTYTSNLRTSISVRRVAIRYGVTRINLQQKGRIKMNGVVVRLPVKDAVTGIRINYSPDGRVHLQLPNGIQILWTGRSFVECTIPAMFKNRIFGLCGNFNGNVRDDYSSPNEIEWCVGPRYNCARHMVNKHDCFRNLQEKNWCRFMFNNELFFGCNAHLNYERYYRTCKMDMCRCPHGKCYCDSLLAYALDCQRLGVKLSTNWRKRTMCNDNNKVRTKWWQRSRHPVVLLTATDEKWRTHSEFFNATTGF